MIHEVGNRLLADAERKFGKLAIPGLLKWIAGLQVLTFLLSKTSPAYIDLLTFDADKIFAGEVWRVISWVFTPRVDNFLFIIIATLFMFFISDSIENAWEPFRLNVFVLATCVLLVLAGLLIPVLFSLTTPLSEMYKQGLYGFMAVLFYSSVFLAFASIYPNQIIHLMMIIPIKAKWLGFVNAAMLLAAVILNWVFAFVVIIGMIPYLLVFGPTFFINAKLRSDNATRRVAFKENTRESGAFHTCETCGKTDLDDPELEFRVAADGEEYCVGCLPQKAE